MSEWTHDLIERKLGMKTPEIMEALYNQCGYKEIEDLILEGEDVNAVAYDYTTPLLVAYRERRNDVVELLIKHGAHAKIDPKMDQSGFLVIASQRNDMEMAKRFMDLGARIDDGLICNEAFYEELKAYEPKPMRSQKKCDIL